MSRLLLIRHAQSSWNSKGLWQGWADPPLTRSGRREAWRAGAWLADAGLAPSAVVSSDLRRARRTAEILAKTLRVPRPGVDHRLRERDVGEWQGRTRDEIDSRWPGMIEEFRVGAVDHPPGGEDSGTLLDRVRASLADAAARDGTGDLLVVTHAGVIRGLERSLGVDDGSIPHLCGRWFEIGAGGEIAAGAPARPRASFR